MADTLTKTVGKGMAWTSLNTLIIKAVGLLSVFLILTALDPYQYGLIELVQSIVPLLSFFLFSGLISVVVADMGVERGSGNISGMKQIFNSFFRLQLYPALILFFFVFFGAHYISRFYTGDISGLLKVISVLFLITPFRNAVSIIQSVYLKFFGQSVYSLLEEIFKVAFIALFFFVFHLTTYGVILAIVCSQIVTLILFAPSYFSLYSQMRGAYAEVVPPWHLLKFHGKWSVVSGYTGTFGQNSRLWIIKFFLGTEAVGLFAVAQGLLGHTSSLVPLNKVITPILPQYLSDKRRFIELLNKSIKYQFLGFLCVGIIGFIFFPPIISFLFPKYASAMPLFQILLITLIPSAFDSVFVPVFFTYKAQKSLFFASIYKVALTIVILPITIYFFGMFGISYGFFLVYCIYAAERYRKLKKILPEFKISLIQLVTVDDFDRLLLKRMLSPAAELWRRIV